MVRTENATLLLVTHDPEIAARADRVLSLREGALVDGTSQGAQ